MKQNIFINLSIRESTRDIRYQRVSDIREYPCKSDSLVQVLAVQHQLSVSSGQSLDVWDTYPKQGLAEHVVNEARRKMREQSALMRLVLQNGELVVGAGAELLPHRRVPVVHSV